MAKTRKKRSVGGGGGNAAGRELMAALQELHDAVIGGDATKLTVRTVEIADPGRYGAREVKALRDSLGVSQAVFARLVAVSPELVGHWEYGIRKPSPVVCRLFDRIKEDPAKYMGSLIHRRSA